VLVTYTVSTLLQAFLDFLNRYFNHLATVEYCYYMKKINQESVHLIMPFTQYFDGVKAIGF